MPKWPGVMQMLVAVLFLMQVPLHLQHNVQGTMLSAPHSSNQHVHSHAGTDKPEPHPIGEDLPSCCAPVLSDFPTALSLPDVEEVRGMLNAKKPSPLAALRVRPGARDPPVGRFA